MFGVFTVEVVLGLRRSSSQKGLREVGVGTTKGMSYDTSLLQIGNSGSKTDVSRTSSSESKAQQTVLLNLTPPPPRF